jgi:hypothetical protein
MKLAENWKQNELPFSAARWQQESIKLFFFVLKTEPNKLEF